MSAVVAAGVGVEAPAIVDGAAEAVVTVGPAVVVPAAAPEPQAIVPIATIVTRVRVNNAMNARRTICPPHSLGLCGRP